MNNTRLLFALASAFLAYMLLNQWQVAHAPIVGAVSAPAITPSNQLTAPTASAELPNASAATPIAAATPSTTPAAGTIAAVVPISSTASAQLVTIETDLFTLSVDLNGADIATAKLKTYTASLSDKTPVSLVQNVNAMWIKAQSGLIAQAGVAPSHLSRFQAPAAAAMVLPSGQATLEVPFSWTDTSGVTVRKIYTFMRGSFAIGVRFEVANGSTTPLTLFPYRQLQQGEPAKPESSFFGSPGGLAYVGSAIYSPDQRFQKLPLPKYSENPLSRSFAGGWMALLQHHFFVSWIPEPAESNTYSTAVLPATANTPAAYLIRQTAPAASVAPGATVVFPAKLYIGPKLTESLQKLAPGLAKVVDYGVFTVFSEPLFNYGLSFFHKLTSNWGWAIILLVVVLKLLFYKLSEAQYRSGAKMKAIQPKIAELKKKFPDDTQKFGLAQMELFKKEKVNPLAGCLPILITIPVFMGLYWVLAESVEMRQAPFIFWIKDLTAADPYFVLPVLNGLVMFATSKMTPMTGMDPMQQKVMTYMPLMFAVMMAFFPAGLVLYWVFNGLLGAAQQYYINQKIEGETKARAK
jgi:YidC/Oxa1 family membrane protein insertase